MALSPKPRHHGSKKHAPLDTCPWCMDAVMTPEKMSERLEKTRGKRFLVAILMASVAVILWSSVPIFAFYVFMAIALIGIGVAVHEAGHLWAALRGKVKVTEYAIGFGMPLWATTVRGVLFSLRLFPMGGFCKIIGMDGDTTICAKHRAEHFTKEQKLYTEASYLRQIWISLAGVTANFVTGWIAIAVSILGMVKDPTFEKVAMVPLYSFAAMAKGLVMTFQVTIEAIASVLSGGGAPAGTGSILSLPGQLSEISGEVTVPVWVLFMIALAAISLSLAVLNAMPMFPLDGSYTVTSLANWFRDIRAKRAGRERPGPLTGAQLMLYRVSTSIPVAVFVAVLIGKDVIRAFTG